MATNYADILAQLHAAGIIVDSLEVGRIVKCRVEGDRERRGWYVVHEVTTSNSEQLLIGSYGIWRGNDNGATKLELRGAKSELSNDQREVMRAKLREDRKRADAVRASEARRAAQRAVATWAKCEPVGESEYLTRKGVHAHGVRFSPSGALVIPMLDAHGVMHGLQIIRSRKQAQEKHRPEKEFWPQGVVKKGHFHLIGGIPTWVVLVAEGYATAATLHEATGYPVAIAWDAGNLAPVAQALRSRYRGARILVCADDDSFAKCQACQTRLSLREHDTTCPACGQAHKRGNTGLSEATTAAVAVNGAFVVPQFADEATRREKFLARGIKLTDFNDLHAAEGLHVVQKQIGSRLGELNWNAKNSGLTSPAAGQGDALRPVESLNELLDRFALVYGQSSTVFDKQEHCLVPLGDMRDVCISRNLHRTWAEHPARLIVRAKEVGFDPGSRDPNITCNLWGGWPTKPAPGKCDKLLQVLRHMCSGSNERSEDLFNWVLRWIAYPIQVPGAKMKTTLVIHGPQGTGKNMFFEAVMSIYGGYGRIIDQSAIEDKFNDWASRKLFLIADEVVARQELFHIKNKLKAFITGDWIRINPKNMSAYEERNHVNLVFLSNENLPVVLDEDDRRHAVIYTPPPLAADFYQDVAEEIRNGGVAALHDYLLKVDLTDFSEHSKPPASAAKLELVEQSRDNISRFFFDLCDGDVPGLRAQPALTTQVYEAYQAWCRQTGHRAAPMNKLVGAFKLKHKVETSRERYKNDLGSTIGPAGFLLLGGVARSECPPGKDRPVWLGECVEAFRTQLKDAAKAAA